MHEGPGQAASRVADSELALPDLPIARLCAQAGLLPPRLEAGKLAGDEGHGEVGRLWVGARGAFAAAVHGLRLDAVVPCAGGFAAQPVLQRTDRHVRAGGDRGGALHAEAALPGDERAGRDLQNLQRARDADQGDVAGGTQARAVDEFPLPTVRTDAAPEPHPEREPGGDRVDSGAVPLGPKQAPDGGAGAADALLPGGHQGTADAQAARGGAGAAADVPGLRARRRQEPRAGGGPELLRTGRRRWRWRRRRARRGGPARAPAARALRHRPLAAVGPPGGGPALLPPAPARPGRRLRGQRRRRRPQPRPPHPARAAPK
mmetsp:Transcript_31217/g.101807  ORF Transcript_31217/g.101807 Transcript_31217/m.101807 type:complete len:318 (-) Transcript_31217:365-1318(-)